MSKMIVPALALGLTLLAIGSRTAQAQDYVAYVEQLAAQAGQRAQMHAQNAVRIYREQTGDWTTPDAQVFAYLDQMARRQNPGFYANLRQREQQFQMQQQQYVANSNAVLDGMYNSYMNRSNMDYRGHQQYVQQGIWEQANYTDGNSVYQLPNYRPGQIYQSNDGSHMIQDDYGQWHHYDAGGWHSDMNEIRWR